MPRKKIEDPSVSDIPEQITENTIPAETNPEEQSVQLSSGNDLTFEEVSLEEFSAAEPMAEPEETPSPKRRTTVRKKAVSENVEAASDEPLPAAEESTVSTAIPHDKNDPKEPVPSRNDFFSLDFHALDRDLTPEQQREWNSIYASFRGTTL